MVPTILTAIGLGEAGSFLAKDVLLPLLKGSLEDYAKDFFKGSIADAVGLASQEPVQKALGKALKTFVELVEEELEFQGCSGAEIRDFYEAPLRQLMKDADVKASLGQAFEPDCRQIDADVLPLRWQTLGLHPLPEEFDWLQIGKRYVREVKGILRSSGELRDLLALHNQEAMRRGINELVGIPPDFDLRKYQETLREQYGNLKLESLDTSAYAYNDLKLWRMFIPQDVRPCQEFNPKVYEIPKEKLEELQQRGELDAEALEAAQIESYRRTYVEQPIQNVLELVGRTAGFGQRGRAVAHYAVVLGDPGSGKSTLLQYVALQWAEQPVGDLKEMAQRPLPLLIELRKYARDRHDNKCSSIVEYLHQGDIACRLNQQRLDEVLKAGDAIALFDGIDEVFDPTLREVVVTDIHRFTNDYPQVQVIATSRWLGYKAQTLRDAGFQHYMLQDLSDEQIADFIERWHDQTFAIGAGKVRKRDRLHKAIRDSKSIRELAGNPLLLTMMAILNRNQELPRDRPELYNQASRVLLHQWDVERNLIEQRLDPVTIDYRDKQAMLRKVAFHMQSGTDGLAGNIISAQDLEAILADYLKSIDIDKPREVARLMIKQLRERNFILCYLGADNYAFIHRTFLEFFAAWAFVWEFKETQTITFEKLRDQTFGAHWQEESWHEVLRLIAGMLEISFAVKATEFLMNQKSQDLPFENLFLAGECFAEIRQRNQAKDVFKKLFLEIQSLTLLSLNEYQNLNAPSQSKESLWQVYGKAIETVCKIYADPEEAMAWLKDLAGNSIYAAVRQIAIQILSRSYGDHSDTFSWLKTQVEANENPAARYMAVQEIALFFKSEPEALLVIQKSAQDDKDYQIRQEALYWLAKTWSDDDKTLAFLQGRVQSDVDDTVRSKAVQEIARRLKDHPNTLPWLKMCAQQYKDASVQDTALEELVEGWAKEPDLFEFWVDFTASNFLEPKEEWEKDLSIITLNVLVQQYPIHPKTLELLQDRAQNDSEPQFKEWAAEQFAKLSSEV